MVKELIQGNLYHLEFIAPYTQKGPYDVEISAIAKKSTLSLYGDFDIKSTFFDEVGIKTYLSMVTDDTDIYICHPIKTYDPIEVTTDEFIFIPKSIINQNACDIYQKMIRYRFNIEGIRRHFESNLDEMEFVEAVESNIPIVLQDTKEIGNDLLSVSNTQDEILVLKSVIDKENENRKAFIDQREANKIALKKAETDREMDFLKRVQAVSTRENLVLQKEGVIDKNVLQSENSKVIGNAFLKMTNDYLAKIKTIYDIIVRQSAGINLPSWDELLVQLTLSTDPDDPEITLEEWKDGVEAYMSGGKFPESWSELESDDCPYCGTPIEKIMKTTLSANKNEDNEDETEN